MARVEVHCHHSTVTPEYGIRSPGMSLSVFCLLFLGFCMDKHYKLVWIITDSSIILWYSTAHYIVCFFFFFFFSLIQTGENFSGNKRWGNPWSRRKKCCFKLTNWLPHGRGNLGLSNAPLKRLIYLCQQWWNGKNLGPMWQSEYCSLKIMQLKAVIWYSYAFFHPHNMHCSSPVCTFEQRSKKTVVFVVLVHSISCCVAMWKQVINEVACCSSQKQSTCSEMQLHKFVLMEYLLLYIVSDITL